MSPICCLPSSDVLAEAYPDPRRTTASTCGYGWVPPDQPYSTDPEVARQTGPVDHYRAPAAWRELGSALPGTGWWPLWLCELCAVSARHGYEVPGLLGMPVTNNWTGGTTSPGITEIQVQSDHWCFWWD